MRKETLSVEKKKNFPCDLDGRGCGSGCEEEGEAEEVAVSKINTEVVFDKGSEVSSS